MGLEKKNFGKVFVTEVIDSQTSPNKLSSVLFGKKMYKVSLGKNLIPKLFYLFYCSVGPGFHKNKKTKKKVFNKFGT